MSECNHDCASCSQSCAERTQPQDLRITANQYSNVKKVIGVVSGKGGVGKSMVTSLLASTMQARGYQTAILDADITGPSIPQCFGVNDRLYSTEKGILPAYSRTGIKIVSTNLILERDSQPVLWRGPILAGLAKQFFNETEWGDVDYMFVDLPPGTGDVPLTVFQSLPLDGIIIVSTPQQLVKMIVEKAVNMARMMNVKIVGLVENMSYVECDNCGNRIYLFGQSKSQQLAEEYGIELLDRLPLNNALTEAADRGAIEEYQADYLNNTVSRIEQL